MKCHSCKSDEYVTPYYFEACYGVSRDYSERGLDEKSAHLCRACRGAIYSKIQTIINQYFTNPRDVDVRQIDDTPLYKLGDLYPSSALGEDTSNEKLFMYLQAGQDIQQGDLLMRTPDTARSSRNVVIPTPLLTLKEARKSSKRWRGVALGNILKGKYFWAAVVGNEKVRIKEIGSLMIIS